jgi:hypothetical protein
LHDGFGLLIVINGSIVGSNPTSVDGFSELIDAALAAQN